jgi:ATP-dependent protease ClpP protease subunit
MITPSKLFRPDPKRAVYIHGTITPELVCSITPRIVSLQSASRDPLTVYIDSRGGDIPSAQALWKLLTSSTLDYQPACKIITIATTRAASAAADLLSSGDYAIVHPHTTVLYHGSRVNREVTLTVEFTSALAYVLRTMNDTYATDLVRQMESRLMFRFLFSKDEFADVRKKSAEPLSDADCFLSVISQKLSDGARNLFETAQQRKGRYEELLAIAKKAKKYKSVAKTEASRIKAIVDYELSSNKKDKKWTFRGSGLNRLNDDFFLLTEHLASSENDRINTLCSQWGIFAITGAEKAEIDAAPEGERKERLVKKVRPTLEPMWSFFVALCHALQEGENELTAKDAYWLGLVDEVQGERKLPCMRMFAEFTPDPPKQEDNEKEKAVPQEKAGAAGA